MQLIRPGVDRLIRERRTEMTPYNRILELHSQGMNNSEIVRTIGSVTRKTVITVLKLVEASGFIYPPDNAMSDIEIHRILHPKKSNAKRVPNMEKTMFMIGLPGMSIAKVWTIYSADCKNQDVTPYSKAQFQNLVNNAKRHIVIPEYKPILAFRYIPNAIEKGEHSYGLLAAELLGSHYIAAALISDKKTRSWIHGIIHVIRQIGCIPNKCCFTSHLPVAISAETEDCLSFYGMELKKAEKGLITRLPEFMEEVIRQCNDSNKSATPIFAVNAICRGYNRMGFGLSENFTIEDAFDIEKNVLYELPKEDYDLVEYTEVSPQFNHVQIDKMYYSIPFEYRHDKLTAYISEQYVEIHRDGIVLCVHNRLSGRPGQYQTDLEHLPNEKDIPWNEPSGKSLRSWADKIGPFTRKTVDYWLGRVTLEVQAYKTCNTVLHLSTRYSPEALERTCKDAWEQKVVYLIGL